ncbi:DNA internalization-related competence protein ComEC/Rec2 [Crassaminicella thermophila]|uniref:DNA internalization-related competence protein ComEC/Rec2 n=1 Tax=Crassaminicella thermophila TaxID=2599308 RepID=A0A5C0SHD9_CRATE|nr:DNA internalization-related competence protein ComEC/Rec2 [Crassaminicella thermophila]QEK12379.1 DNA internalization-related competence protein ComEC/Rec2 [Crassaminicella thermophila]
MKIVRRPICGISIFYALGIFLQYKLSISYKVIMYVFCIIVMIGFFICRRKWIVVILFVFILLFGALNFKLNSEYEGQLKQFFNNNVYVVGDVINVSNKDKPQLTLKVVNVIVNSKSYRISDKIIIKFRQKHNKLGMVMGKRVGIYGILLEPQKRRNPKMFDYQMYLKNKRIYGILYAADKLDIIGKGNISFVLRIANIIKNKISNVIYNIMPNKEGNILLGIIFGDKDRLDVKTYKVFRKAGIAHILAVSGLHIGIVYMFLNRLLKGFLISIKTFIILVIFCFYVIITGYAPSVLRATLMVTVFIFAPLVNRRYDSISAIFTIGFIILVINPIYLMNIGFQLSFIAALSIIIFYKEILKRLVIVPNPFREILAVSVAAQIGIIPIVGYHFNYISLGAFIVNVPVVMIMSLLVPLGICIILIGLISLRFASILGFVVLFFIKVIMVLSYFIEKIPFSSIEVISPSFFFIIIYYLFFIFLTIEEDKIFSINKKNAIFIIIGLYVVINIVSYIIPNKMEIVFIDVGQGDCILIRTPRNKNILIDGGGSSKKMIDVGEDVLVPCLLKNGIKRFDMIILSHIHKDHIQGLLSVLDHLKVDTLVMGTDFYQSEDLKLLKEKCIHQGTKIYKGIKDDKIIVEDDLVLRILNPSRELIMDGGDDINNNSLVILMTYKDKNILFTGDIEAEAEKKIVKSYPNLSIDVLKVAHHGSNSSSTEEFIKLISPKIAIIQVGKNYFGHPHKEVLNRFKKNHIIVFRNDKNGAVSLYFCGEKIKIKKMIENEKN